MSFGRDKPRQGLQRPFCSGVEDCHCACLQCQLRTIVDLSRNHSHGSDGGELLWVCNHNRQIADHWMNPRGTLARMGWGIKKKGALSSAISQQRGIAELNAPFFFMPHPILANVVEKFRT